MSGDNRRAEELESQSTRIPRSPRLLPEQTTSNCQTFLLPQPGNQMSGQYDWLVQIPDHPNAQSDRMSNLSAHLNYNKPLIVAGQMVLSGPTLSAQPKSENEIPKMTGSVMLLKTGSEEEVWEMVRENPYAKVRVWDLDKAVITPFRCAVRTAM
ncbi:hypothetical protein MMC17_002075 [Xylographa soralifera]|nr:hypothetical protein [Xylographa soralifera]